MSAPRPWTVNDGKHTCVDPYPCPLCHNENHVSETSRPTVLVCGGRDFRDWDRVCRTLDRLDPKPLVIVHGAAAGADTLADKWAHLRQIAVHPHAANWRELGKAAGPIRNQEMLDLEKPHFVIAFPGGRGTADLCCRAREMGIPVHYR